MFRYPSIIVFHFSLQVSSALILIIVIIQTINAETRTTLSINSHTKPHRSARSIFSYLWGPTQPKVELPVVNNHIEQNHPIWKVHKYNGIALKPLTYIPSANVLNQQLQQYPIPVPHLNQIQQKPPVLPAAVPINNLPPATPAPAKTFLQRIVRPFFGSSVPESPVLLPQPPPNPIFTNVQQFLPPPQAFIPNIPLNQLVYTASSTPVPFGTHKEFSTTLDLVALARELGVSGNQLPSLEEAGNLLGTTTQDETIDAIKELIQTKDGLDLIRSYIKSNSIESRQFIVDASPQNQPTFSKQQEFYQVAAPHQPLPQSLRSISGIPSGLDRLNKDLTIARTVIPTVSPNSGLLGRLSQVRNFFSFNNPLMPIVQLSTTPTPEVVSVANVEKPLIIKTVDEYPQRIEGIALPQLPVLRAPAIAGLNQLPFMPSMPNVLIPKYLPYEKTGKYMYAKYPQNGFDPFPGFSPMKEANTNVLHQYKLPTNEPTKSYNLQDNSEIFGKIGNSQQINQLTQRRSGFEPVRNADQFYAEGKMYTANPDMISFNTQSSEGRMLGEPKMTLVYSKKDTTTMTTPVTVPVSSTVQEVNNAVKVEKGEFKVITKP
jgi:hypothetical protein